MTGANDKCIFDNLTINEWVLLAQTHEEEIKHLNGLLDQYIPLFYW